MEGCPWVALSPLLPVPSATGGHGTAAAGSCFMSCTLTVMLFLSMECLIRPETFSSQKKKESRCWDDTIIVVLIVFFIFYIRLLAAEGVAYALFMHFFHWLLFLFFSPNICFLFDDVEHTRVYLIQLRASSFILSPSPSSFLLSFVIGGLALLCKRGIVLCLRSENSFSSFWASIHLFTVFVCLFSWSVFSLFLCNSLFVFFFKI